MRDPQPLLRRRLPSGRGATEQPNVTSDTDARLSPRFWVAVVATGVATGLAGIAMMVVLSVAEHLAFGYHDDGIVATLTRFGGSLDFQGAVEASSGTRRVVVLGLAGVFGGLAVRHEALLFRVGVRGLRCWPVVAGR